MTSASLILFFAFGALASGPAVDVKILATGLAAGILLDATIIRALRVAAIVSLFGSMELVPARRRGEAPARQTSRAR